MNGWQRIWAALTGAGFVGAILYSAYAGLSYGTGLGTWEYERDLKADLTSGKCASYISKPLETLNEPKIDTPCYMIYNARKYDKAAPTPYTIERYHAKKTEERWSQFGIAISVLGIFVILTSAFVYLVGWLVAWIRRGFA